MKIIPFEEVAGDDRRRLAPEVEREHVEAVRELVAYQLAELRKAKGVTQTAIAAALGMTQPSISKLETGQQRDKLSILRGYIEALGGRLELTAVFDDERWVLHGLTDQLEEPGETEDDLRRAQI